jgi:hypothetical protein
MSQVLENVVSVAETAVDNVVESTNNVVENVVENVDSTVESVVDNVNVIVENVNENVNKVIVKKPKQPVSFVIDVESKAIVESMAEALDNFTVDKLMVILPKLIGHVQNYKNLGGKEKRTLVIKMLNHVIDITDCPGDDEVWDPIMKRLVPSIIDTLIKVENKQLVLRKKPKWLGRLFTCCLPK